MEKIVSNLIGWSRLVAMKTSTSENCEIAIEPIRCLTRRQRHREAYVAFELNRSATNIHNDPSVSALCAYVLVH